MGIAAVLYLHLTACLEVSFADYIGEKANFTVLYGIFSKNE